MFNLIYLFIYLFIRNWIEKQYIPLKSNPGFPILSRGECFSTPPKLLSYAKRAIHHHSNYSSPPPAPGRLIQPITLTHRQLSTAWQSHQKAEPSIASSVDDDMKDIFIRIRQELSGREPDLCEVASYYFDGQGKAIRPMLAILMARAVNAHLRGEGSGSELLPGQKQLALVSEMIHTATLVHDDVIDRSDKRRGKPSVNALFGQRKSIVGGDYVLAKAGAMVARLDNNAVTEIFAQVLEDLVHGEFMQMGANEEKTERFAHYIGKTFNKTASLMGRFGLF